MIQFVFLLAWIITHWPRTTTQVVPSSFLFLRAGPYHGHDGCIFTSYSTKTINSLHVSQLFYSLTKDSAAFTL